MNGYLATTTFYVDGIVARDAPEAHYRMISPDYFRALAIPLRRGRGFTAADRHDSAPVVVINETFARTYFQGRDPIGCRMRLDDGEKVPREVEVVGIVGDVRHFGLERESTLEVYVPIAQVPDPTTIWLANNMYWVIETDGPPLAVTGAVRRAIAAVDPGVPASFVRSMDQWLGKHPGGAALQSAARRHSRSRRCCSRWSASTPCRRRPWLLAAGDRHPRRARRVTPTGCRARADERPPAPVLAGLAAGAVVAVVCGAALCGMLFGVPPWDPVVARHRRHDARRRGAPREPRPRGPSGHASIRLSRCV